MLLNCQLNDVPVQLQSQPIILLLGNFGIYHDGHCQLLATAKKLKTKHQLAVFILKIQPKVPLANKKYFNDVIYLQPEVETALTQFFAVDGILSFEITTITKDWSGLTFINFLKSKLNIQILICGQNFKFGCDREGDVKFLKTHFPTTLAIKEKTAPIHFLGYPTVLQIISTTNWINYLISSQINFATGLNHQHYYFGYVKAGWHLSQQQQTPPTININLPKNLLLPPPGVYAGRVLYSHRFYKAVFFLHERDQQPLLEAHLLNFNKMIYEQVVFCQFLHFLRPAIKIDPLMLKHLIHHDCQIATTLLKHQKPLPNYLKNISLNEINVK